MPLLDSFKVDHTRIHAPAARVAKTMIMPKGDTIAVFGPRFCVPDKEILSEKGIHTLEHLLAGFIRDHSSGNGVEVIDIPPMGCHTGFYTSLIGIPDEQRVADVWLAPMQDVVDVKDRSKIPELNEYQCGTYLIHSLAEAREIAQNVLARKVAANRNEDLMLDDDFLKGQFPFFDEDEIRVV